MSRRPNAPETLSTQANRPLYPLQAGHPYHHPAGLVDFAEGMLPYGGVNPYANLAAQPPGPHAYPPQPFASPYGPPLAPGLSAQPAFDIATPSPYPHPGVSYPYGLANHAPYDPNGNRTGLAAAPGSELYAELSHAQMLANMHQQHQAAYQPLQAPQQSPRARRSREKSKPINVDAEIRRCISRRRAEGVYQ